MVSKIDGTKFSFKAFRDLKRNLGKFDAVVECNELAIRNFLADLQSSANPNMFIRQLADKHDIKVNSLQTELFETRIRCFYIISVMQQAEQFFDDFRTEIRPYYPSWQAKKEGETDLDWVIRNVYSREEIDKISQEVRLGYDYYRLVRNRFLHTERDTSKMNRLYNQVREYTSFYNSVFHIDSCPNKYDKINYSDFILLTNIVKHIGYTLCRQCKLSNLQIAREIQAISLKRISNNPIRFAKAMGSLIDSKFGQISEVDKKEIISILTQR